MSDSGLTLRAVLTADSSAATAGFDETATSAETAADKITEAFDAAATAASESSAKTSEVFTETSAEIGELFEGLGTDGQLAFEKIAVAADTSGTESTTSVTESTSKIAELFDGVASDASASFDKITEAAAAAASDDEETWAEAAAKIAELYDEMAASVDASFDKIAEAAEAASGETGEESEAATAKVAELYDAMAADVSAAYAKIDEAAATSAAGVDADAAESTAVIGGMWEKVGEIAAVVFAAVIVGSADLADKFDADANKIAASSGISQEAALKMGNAFLTAANGTIFSGTEWTAAFAGVAGQLKEINGQALTTAQGVTVMTAASNLAAASGLDLTSATSSLVAVMQSFQVPVKDAATVSDLLYSAANRTGVTVDAESAALVKLKAKLGDLAPPLAQVTGLQLDLANNGERGRASLTALSTFTTALIKPTSDLMTAQQNLKVAGDALPPSLLAQVKAIQNGANATTNLTALTGTLSSSQAALVTKYTSASTAADTATQAQAKMGITVTGTNGKLLPMVDIIGQLHDQIAGMSPAMATAKLTADGFGSSSSKLVGIIQAGPAAYSKYVAQVNAQNAAHAAAQKATDNLKDSLKVLEGELENEGVKIGNVLMPKIRDLVDIFGSTVGWVLKTKDVLVPLGILLGVTLAGAAAIFAVNMGVKAYTAVVKFGGQLKTAGTAISNLVTKIFGLGAASEEQAATTTAASEESQLAFEGMGTAAETAGDAELAAGETGGAGMDAMLGPIGIVLIAATLLATHWQDVKKLLDVVWDGIKAAVSACWDWVTSHLSIVMPIILGIVTGGIGTLVYELVTHWTTIKDDVTAAWDDIVSFFTGIPGKIVGALEDLGSDVAGIATSAWDAFTGVITSAVDADVSFVEGLPGRFIAGLESLGSDLANLAKSAWDAFSSAIVGAWDAQVGWFASIPGAILNALGDAASKLYDWGTGLVSGLIKGISDAAGSIGSGIVSLITSAFDSVKSTVNSIPVIGTIAKLAGFATGGYVTQPTLAVVGEAGPEYIIPESLIKSGAAGVMGLPNLPNTGGGSSAGTASNTSQPATANRAAPNVYVNVATGASAQQIGNEVGWALRTAPV